MAPDTADALERAVNAGAGGMLELATTDGRLTVSLRVTDPVWLRGLLLRLGGGACVVSPPGAGNSAAEAAQEALDQYAALGYLT